MNCYASDRRAAPAARHDGDPVGLPDRHPHRVTAAVTGTDRVTTTDVHRADRDTGTHAVADLAHRDDADARFNNADAVGDIIADPDSHAHAQPVAQPDTHADANPSVDTQADAVPDADTHPSPGPDTRTDTATDTPADARANPSPDSGADIPVATDIDADPGPNDATNADAESYDFAGADAFSILFSADPTSDNRADSTASDRQPSRHVVPTGRGALQAQSQAMKMWSEGSRPCH